MLWNVTPIIKKTRINFIKNARVLNINTIWLTDKTLVLIGHNNMNSVSIKYLSGFGWGFNQRPLLFQNHVKLHV